MSLHELARRSWERQHPASSARITAQQRQIARGNHPEATRMTSEIAADMCWDPLLGLRYRAALEEKLKAAAL